MGALKTTEHLFSLEPLRDNPLHFSPALRALLDNPLVTPILEVRARTKIVQGWPKLWANFRALMGIFSQSVAWAKPRNLGQPCTIFVAHARAHRV
jgi:hypothetical protein